MSSIEGSLSKRVTNFLGTYLTAHNNYIVAYSGGPDSTALLLTMVELRKKYHFTLYAAYIDHGIRNLRERTAEDNLVSRVLSTYDIPSFRYYIPEGSIEKKASKAGGIEAAARRLRYDFFADLSETIGYVLFAHTFDDQMETQIMRFFQGSGPEGLAGMPPVRDNYLRPFLEVKKEEIYAYLEEKGVEYSRDSTNEEDVYLRNRIRQRLLPVIREIFPGVERALSESAWKMRAYTERHEIPWQREDDGSISFEKTAFAGADELRRMQLLYELWDIKHGDTPRRMPGRFVREVAGRLAERAKAELSKKEPAETDGAHAEVAVPEGEIELRKPVVQGHGVAYFESQLRFFFFTDIVREEKKSYLKMMKEGKMDLPSGAALEVRVEKKTEDELIREDQTEELIVCSDSDSAPCVLRSPNSGDTICIPNGNQVSCAKVLKKNGIPSEERWKNPVIEDRRGILALLYPESLSSSVVGLYGKKEECGEDRKKAGVIFRIGRSSEDGRGSRVGSNNGDARELEQQ